jgi:hypothetical protein
MKNVKAKKKKVKRKEKERVRSESFVSHVTEIIPQVKLSADKWTINGMRVIHIESVFFILFFEVMTRILILLN